MLGDTVAGLGASLVTGVSELLASLSGGNEFVQGALTLWLLSVVTWVSRGVPSALWEFVKRHSVTSMSINNGGWEEQRAMNRLMSALQDRMSHRFSRSLSISIDPYSGGQSLVAGYGLHYFWHRGRLFWLTKDKLESSGSERQKEEVTIRTFGRSHEPFRRLLADFSPPADETMTRKTYTMAADGDWKVYAKSMRRPLDSLAIDAHVRDSLVTEIEHFLSNREWYLSRGLSWKLVYLLHGQPGTGKTSIATMLADHFGKHLCRVNLATCSDGLLEAGLANLPKDVFVSIDDFDCATALHSRSAPTDMAPKGGDSIAELSMLTLSGFLGVMDGIVPLDGAVIFMTTNHLEKIDPAVYRPGRVDRVIELPPVSGETIADWAARMYPDQDFRDVRFRPSLACNLSQCLKESSQDGRRFKQLLLERGVATPAVSKLRETA